MTASRVGFVGLGAMGAPMARRLLERSQDLTIYARRPEVREEFVDLGAEAAGSIAELAQRSDIVVVCVFDNRQLLDVLHGEDGVLANMAPGSILVSHTTGNPDTIRSIGDAGAVRGVIVLDAPVSGDPGHIPLGRLTVVVSGDPAAIERCRPAFETYSNNIIVVGDEVGAAMAVKLVNNLLMAATLQLGQQALLVGKAMGADIEAMRAVIPVSSGASYSFDVAARFDSVERLDELAGPYLRKDIDLAVGVMREMGVDPGILEHTADNGPLTFRSHPTT